jgi:hypothetical protein
VKRCGTNWVQALPIVSHLSADVRSASASFQDVQKRSRSWSGRPDSNRRPPAPKSREGSSPMVADLGKTESAFLFIGRPKPLSPAFQGWICKNLQPAATLPEGQARLLSTICLRRRNGAGSVDPTYHLTDQEFKTLRPPISPHTKSNDRRFKLIGRTAYAPFTARAQICEESTRDGAVP